MLCRIFSVQHFSGTSSHWIIGCVLILLSATGCLPIYTVPPMPYPRTDKKHAATEPPSYGTFHAVFSDCTTFKRDRKQAFKYVACSVEKRWNSGWGLLGSVGTDLSLEILGTRSLLSTQVFGSDIFLGGGTGYPFSEFFRSPEEVKFYTFPQIEEHYKREPSLEAANWYSGGSRVRVSLPFFRRHGQWPVQLQGGVRHSRVLIVLHRLPDLTCNVDTYSLGLQVGQFSLAYSHVTISDLTRRYTASRFLWVQPEAIRHESVRFRMLSVGFSGLTDARAGKQR